MEQRYENNNKELRMTIAQLRKEIGNKSLKEEDLKRKIRELEREIESKVYDLEKEKYRNQEQSDREKMDLIRELEMYQKENNNLKH